MEFSDVGAHCEVEVCRERDFLPFVCTFCRGTYCLAHRSCGHHSCPVGSAGEHDGSTVECPVCGQVVAAKKGEKLDAAVATHLDGGCRSTSRAVQCNAPRCRNSEVLKVQCTDCRKLYCVAHRWPQDHECAVWKKKQQREQLVQQQHQQKQQQQENASPLSSHLRSLLTAVHDRLGRKDPARAKAEQQRLARQRAQGDAALAEERRWYAEVYLPFAMKREHPASVWVNNAWSVGKALDYLCDKLGVKYDPTKPAERLYMYNLETGEKLSNLVLLRDLKKTGNIVLIESDIAGTPNVQNN